MTGCDDMGSEVDMENIPQLQAGTASFRHGDNGQAIQVRRWQMRIDVLDCGRGDERGCKLTRGKERRYLIY